LKPLGLWTLPNAITWFRVLIAVPIILLLVDGSAASLWTALGLMIASEVSDGVDGYVARRYGQVSAVGKILDPMADSLYRISVFSAFVANQWMPVWMFLIMAWREIAMSYLRIVAEQKIGTMAARSSGKVKAFFQGATQLLVVFAYASMGPTLSPDLGLAVWLALLVSTVLSAGSLIDYILVIIRGLRAGSN